MSIENHPNIHAVNLMLEIHKAIEKTIRGEKSIKLDVGKTLAIAKFAAETIEELIDAECEK